VERRNAEELTDEQGDSILGEIRTEYTKYVGGSVFEML
jgi:hypothetical protein